MSQEANNANQIQYNRCKQSQLILFPLNEGVGNLFLVVMMFASYVAAGGYGIAVATAGVIATGTRILDGVTDPIIALVVDKFNTKFGKIRILLAIGYIIAAGAIYLMFFVGPGSGMFVYILLYCIYIIGYTIMGITRTVANAALTNDPKQRPIIYRWSSIYTTILSSSVGIYMSKVLFPKYGGLSMEAFQELAITVIIVTAILMIIAMISYSDKDTREAFENMKASKQVTAKEGFKIIKENKALQSFIVAATSDKLALQAAGNSAITTLVFGMIINNYAFNGTLTFYNMFVTLGFILFATGMAVKGGTKKSLVKWTIISAAIATAIVVFMTVIDPTNVSVVPWITIVFIALYACFSAAKVATSTCTGAMIPDVIDYEFSRSGNYMPGTVGAVYSFIDKIITSLSTTIVGFALAAIGYSEVMPQPGDPVNSKIFVMAMFLWMGLPILGWLCTLVAMKFYPLDKEKMHEVQLINQRQREEAKQK